MRVIDKNDNEVKPGDEIPDFRGKKWIFQSISRGRKVIVKDPTVLASSPLSTREFFPTVFSLRIGGDDEPDKG